MKKSVYLCVDLTARTQEASFRPAETKKGLLMMSEEGERFEFDEVLPETCERNPKLWMGHRLNIHKNKQAQLVINFRRTILDAKLDPCTFADEVFVELEKAKAALGL